MGLDRTHSARDRSAGWILPVAAGLLVASLAGPAGAASFQTAEKEFVSVPRLKFEKKCFYDLEGWKGKGEEKFLERVEDHKAAYEADPDRKGEFNDLLELLGECYMLRKDHYEAAKNMEQVKVFYRKILALNSTHGKLEKFAFEAGEYLLAGDLDDARGLMNSNKLGEARTKWQGLARIAKAEKEAVEALVNIEKVEFNYDAAAQGGDLEVQRDVFGKILDAIKATLGADLYASWKDRRPDISDMDKRRADILARTQYLVVGNFDVSADLANVRLGEKIPLNALEAAYLFEPVSKDVGQRFPLEGASAKAPKERFLFFKGTYDVAVFAPGATARPAAVFLRFTVGGDGDAKFSIPNRVPEGMVFVGPWSNGGNFFVDVTEVTVGQVKAVKGNDAVLGQVLKDSNTGDGDPAWFEEAGAEAFEKASGKSIPTEAQWLQAAFGPYSVTERPYPWGKERPTGDRAFTDTGKVEPLPVGGRPLGRSPFHAEDMAGNMAEWVRGKSNLLWLIGGHYNMTPADLTNLEGKNPLRDTLPGPVAYEQVADTMSPAERTKFSMLKIDATQKYVTGLRMVVPVK